MDHQSLHSFNVPVPILDFLVLDVHHMTKMPLLSDKVSKRSVFGTDEYVPYMAVQSCIQWCHN